MMDIRRKKKTLVNRIHDKIYYVAWNMEHTSLEKGFRYLGNGKSFTTF